MSAYVIFDVDIRDGAKYREFMDAVKPALEAAGARYLVRGGAHKVYEGDWVPRRIVLLGISVVRGLGRLLQWRDLSGSESDPGCLQLRAPRGRGRIGVKPPGSGRRDRGNHIRVSLANTRCVEANMCICS
jgi:Domain of unknown function (DUF1330)